LAERDVATSGVHWSWGSRKMPGRRAFAQSLSTKTTDTIWGKTLWDFGAGLVRLKLINQMNAHFPVIPCLTAQPPRQSAELDLAPLNKSVLLRIALPLARCSSSSQKLRKIFLPYARLSGSRGRAGAIFHST
jgi:hypothetical protein